MRRIHPAGFFEAICPLPDGKSNGKGSSRYLLRIAEAGGKNITTMHDPYAFPPLLSDYDLHLLNEGRHWRLYEKLGRSFARSTAWKGLISPSGPPTPPR